MGAESTGIDATIFAMTAGALCPHFSSPLRDAAERHDNLRGYVDRMMARYYGDWGKCAPGQAAA
jgi:hypothetical protein